MTTGRVKRPDGMRPFGQALLVLVMTEDGGRVWCAPIDALSAGISGIDHPPKAIQQRFAADLVRRMFFHYTLKGISRRVPDMRDKPSNIATVSAAAHIPIRPAMGRSAV